MPFALAFEYFDPFDGKRLPETFPPSLNGVSQRARILLKGRNRADLAAMAKELHRMMIAGYTEGVVRDIQLLNELGETRGPVNRVNQLRAYFDKFDGQPASQTHHGGPAEYFAALALAAIGETAYIQHDHPDGFSENTYSPTVFELADIATESIVHAETLRSALRSTGDRGRSTEKRKFDGLREACLKLYDARYTEAKSYGEAAFLVHLDLSDEQKSKFRTKMDKSRERTIRRWLTKYRSRKSN